MSDEAITVEGSVARVTYTNAETGYRVVRVDTVNAGNVAWVGVMPAVANGERLRARGVYVHDERYGRQFRVETVEPIIPSTKEGLTRYLGANFIPGVGPGLAKRIVDTFGEKTIEILDSDPSKLSGVKGISPEKAKDLGEAWAEKRAVGVIMVFLQQHGASPGLATRIYRRYGARAVSVVQKSPYLLALEVDGVGFKTADMIARSLGVGEASVERGQAAVLHVLQERAGHGHVYVEEADLARLTVELLQQDVGVVYAAIRALDGARRIRREALDEEHTAVFAAGLQRAEERLASSLLALMAAKPTRPKDAPDVDLSTLVDGAIRSFETDKGVRLAEVQCQAVRLAAREKVLVLTGGPGTGKTTCLLALLRLFEAAKLRVRLAAPTGRAAKRMSEATGREGATVHRLLEFRPGAGFTRDAEKPIEADVLIVDESSMLELALADHLVQAISLGARLVFVGDVDQLPSVGPGAVLRDIIGSNVVPTVRLQHIHRQAEGSLITVNAHRINRGEAPQAGPAGGEFLIVETTEQLACADAIVDLVTRRIPLNYGFHPVTDIHVLCPMRKGDAGVTALNARLQAELNPHGQAVSRLPGAPRVGDKVMQLKNDYDREVFNGDIGYVTAVDTEDQSLTVDIDGRAVQYAAKHFEQLTLAYATSIHKFQGAEGTAVIIPLLTAHHVMLTRKLVYTGVTRGRKLVVLVADPRAIRVALRETRRDERRTRLADRLRGAC